MIFGSVCSGIEAASVAWRPLGWRPAFFSEIDKFPSAVLAHHYPDVPNYGDMTNFRDWPDHELDLLVGGTPCQSFSVAGLRKGLADPRGNLALVFLAIADRYRPRWLLWENVPGVLSIDGGRAFGSILGALGELGYGFAYRVLDAQHVRVDGLERAVPQRRRRVFVVGHLGDWRRAAAVLFERESLRGNPPPRREAGKGLAGTASRSFAGCIDGQNAADIGDLCGTLQSEGLARQNRGFMVAHSLRAEGFDASEDGTGRGVPLVAGTLKSCGGKSGQPNGAEEADRLIPVAFSCKDHGADAGETAPTLRAMGHSGSHPKAGGQVAVAFNARQDPIHQAVAFTQNSRSEVRLIGQDGSVVGALAADHGVQQQNYVASQWAVRRLTPLECERLQGFPDNYTAIPYRGKEAADGPRYKALGNSMAVNCMRWIGRRIQMVEDNT